MPNRGASGKVTTNHDEIRRWVEARGGCPATVKRTRANGAAGILRIDYPGYSGRQSLEPIGWDEFFDKFDQMKLAFLYQDETAAGEPSRFSKLIARDAENTRTRRGPGARATGGRGARRSSATSPQASGASRGSSRRSAAGSTGRSSTGRSSTGGTARGATSKRSGSARTTSARTKSARATRGGGAVAKKRARARRRSR